MLAQYVVVHENWLAAAPASLDDVQASTLPCARLTAWFALQIAKVHGAEVYVTSASDEKLVRAKALGAYHGINRLNGDWVDTVYELTQDQGLGLQPVIDRVYRFDQLPQALDHLDRGAFDKIVLTP